MSDKQNEFSHALSRVRANLLPSVTPAKRKSAHAGENDCFALLDDGDPFSVAVPHTTCTTSDAHASTTSSSFGAATAQTPAKRARLDSALGGEFRLHSDLGELPSPVSSQTAVRASTPATPSSGQSAQTSSAPVVQRRRIPGPAGDLASNTQQSQASAGAPAGAVFGRVHF